MTWLVTGGAGYIGSHVVRALIENHLDPVVIDDLSSGFRRFVPDGVPFVEASLLDRGAVDEVLEEHAVTGVIHLAGFKYAGVSVTRPIHTYEQNVVGMMTLLDAMAQHRVDRFVFSSSAAVYGTPDVEIVTESTRTAPESPYGETKLVGEWLTRDLARSGSLHHTSLRYFNVVGSGSPDLFDTSPHNLFPVVFDVLIKGGVPQINGDDYDTADGTCIRDYVHVTDLARSHAVAARSLETGEPLEPVYNLGSGQGVSVRAIMSSIRQVTGIDFEPRVAPRRAGDPARIVADGTLASRDLDWRMTHDLTDMVTSAWAARVHAGDSYPHT